MSQASIPELTGQLFEVVDAGGGGADLRRRLAAVRERLGGATSGLTRDELVALIERRTQADAELLDQLTNLVLEALADYDVLARLDVTRSAAQAPLAEQLAAAARAGIVPAGPAEDGLVDCTVFAPPAAPAGEPVLVQVFTHGPQEARGARDIAAGLDPTAVVRGFHSLELDVALDARLTFELSARGGAVDLPVRHLRWRRRTAAVQFILTPSGPGACFATVAISVDGVPAGDVTFRIEIGAVAPPGPTSERARRYTAAFVSYASADRTEVLVRTQMLNALGIDAFQDVLSLRAGDQWEQRLLEELASCDLFLLFWSSAARDSKWVRREVAHALRRVETDELAIRLVLIEGPPVPKPWDELSHLHFNDSALYVLSYGSGADVHVGRPE
jgi:hypothetical protein